MQYITNPYKSWITMWLLYPMRGSLLQCWPADAINLELPLYGLPPTSFVHWLILPLTPPRNWNPCGNSRNSLAVKRTTSWPNPVEVNALLYSICDIQFNWLRAPFDNTFFKTFTAIQRVSTAVLHESCVGIKWWWNFRYETFFGCVTTAIIQQAFGRETTDICH
jgi:hypothetical protein